MDKENRPFITKLVAVGVLLIILVALKASHDDTSHALVVMVVTNPYITVGFLLGIFAGVAIDRVLLK